MKFGDQVKINDGSKVDGCVGIIYTLEENRAIVLLDKEVFWPVELHCLELVDKKS